MSPGDLIDGAWAVVAFRSAGVRCRSGLRLPTVSTGSPAVLVGRGSG